MKLNTKLKEEKCCRLYHQNLPTLTIPMGEVLELKDDFLLEYQPQAISVLSHMAELNYRYWQACSTHQKGLEAHLYPII